MVTPVEPHPRQFIECEREATAPSADLPDRQFVDPPVQPRLQKYSASQWTQIKSISLAVPPHRGAYPDRQRRGAGCGGRGSVGRVRDGRAGLGLSQTRERSNGAQTTDAEADGKAVWSWHPLLVSSWRRHLGPTGRGYAV